MAVISSVGDCCFVSTPLVSFEVEYESCFVVAQPEKTQVLAVTRKHSKNARIFFIAWSCGLTTKAEPQPRQPGFTWNDDIQSRDHGQTAWAVAVGSSDLLDIMVIQTSASKISTTALKGNAAQYAHEAPASRQCAPRYL